MWVWSRLAQPEGSTDRFCVLFLILPEDGSRIQLPKCCDFIYNLDDGQSPKKTTVVQI
jgi:hypothetical protein